MQRFAKEKFVKISVVFVVFAMIVGLMFQGVNNGKNIEFKDSVVTTGGSLPKHSVEEGKAFSDEIIKLINEEESLLNLSSYGSDANKSSNNRLIVYGDIKSNYGAIKDISGFLDYHILVYQSQSEKQFAYESFKRDGVIVSSDNEQTITSYANNDYVYTDYMSWGAEAIDVGGYLEYLSDNNVEDEIVVGVLDTGINTQHEMFYGDDETSHNDDRLLFDGDGNIVGFTGYETTYTYSGYGFEDGHGHGSHCSGIICGITPKNIKILPMKILTDGGSGYDSVIIAALEEVVNYYSNIYNIACLSMSFGASWPDGNSLYSPVFDELREKGILPVVAGGNESTDVKNCSPAGCENAITVSALAHDDVLGVHFEAEYSNFGEGVDISAPGTAVTSAICAVSNSSAMAGEGKNRYATWSGTSMATPHVSAVVALLCSDPLNRDISSGKLTWSAQDIENRLKENALDLGDYGDDTYYGAGQVYLRYFEMPTPAHTLNFSYNNTAVTTFNKWINLDTEIALDVVCSDPSYRIFYTSYASKYVAPTLSTVDEYVDGLRVSSTTRLNCIGFKFDEDGNIIERTKIYNLQFFFDSASPEDYFYIDEDDNFIVAYYGNFKNLVIPETINGVEVKGIAHYTFEFSCLESVEIPKTCVDIGAYAFAYSENLKSVYAEGATTFYTGCFLGCKSLQFMSATRLRTMQQECFTNCTSITKVLNDYPEETETEGLYFPNLTSGAFFRNCTALETVSLPKVTTVYASYSSSDLDAVYPSCFAGCKNLVSCTLGLSTIPQEAFLNCEKLETFVSTAENGVSEIGVSAFSGCTSLWNISFQDNLRIINNLAFYNCKNLSYFYVGKSLYSIGSDAFTGTGIKQFYIDSTNTNFYSDGRAIYSKSGVVAYATAGPTISYEIKSLVNISGTNYTITEIGDDAFLYAKFAKLTIPSSITSIHYSALAGTAIDELCFNANLVDESEYWNNSGHLAPFNGGVITKLTVGTSVSIIPNYLFFDCVIGAISFSTDTLSIGVNAFKLTSSENPSELNENVINEIYLDFESSSYTTFLERLATIKIATTSLEEIYLKSNLDLPTISPYTELTYSYSEGGYYIKSTSSTKNYLVTLNYNDEAGTLLVYGTDITTNFNAPSGWTGSIVFSQNEGYRLTSVFYDGIDYSEYIEDLLTIGNGLNIENITGNHFIVANFEKIHSVTFKKNNGEADEVKKYVFGETITLSDAVKNYYDFNCWCTDIDLKHTYVPLFGEFFIMPDWDFCVYANWLPTVYTITFISDGHVGFTEYDNGEKILVTEKTLTYTIETVDAPTIPEYSVSEHYLFGSYQVVLTNGNWALGDYVWTSGNHGDFTVKVVTTPVLYQISFDLPNNIKEVEIDLSDYTYTVETTECPNLPEILVIDELKEFYIFNYWRVKETDENSSWQVGDFKWKENSNGHYGNIVLTPRIGTVQYEVTLTSSTVGGTLSSYEKLYYSIDSEEGPVLPTPIPDVGYRFVRWAIVRANEDSSWESFVGEEYEFHHFDMFDEQEMYYGNLTLEAQFEIITYTLTIEKVGHCTMPNTDIFNYNVLSTNGPTLPTVIANPGYEFMGWKITQVDDESCWILDGSYIWSQDTAGKYGNVTISPNIRAITYTIYVVVATSGNGSISDGSVNYTIETTTNPIFNVLVPDNGYKLDKIVIVDSQNSTWGNNGDTFNWRSGNIGNIVVEVSFMIRTYSIRLNLNNKGSLVGQTNYSYTMFSDQNPNISTAVTPNFGYSFVGWQITSITDGGGWELNSNYEWKPSVGTDYFGDLVLTAIYNPLPFLVTFYNYDKQTVVDSFLADFDTIALYSKQTLPTKVATSGNKYVFVGWENETGEMETSFLVTGERKYYAVFSMYGDINKTGEENIVSVVQDEVIILASDLKGIKNENLIVELKTGTFVVPSAVLIQLSDKNKDATFKISLVNNEELLESDELKNKTVYNVEILSGENSLHTLYGKVQVKLLYTLKTGEDASKLVLLHQKLDGSLEKVDSAVYSDGEMSFSTSSLSNYIIDIENIVEEEKPKKTNNVLIIIICVWVVALIGLMIILIKRKKR